MAHHFEIQRNDIIICIHCGETKDYLSSRIGVDGRKPICADAPGNLYLVYLIISLPLNHYIPVIYHHLPKISLNMYC